MATLGSEHDGFSARISVPRMPIKVPGQAIACFSPSAEEVADSSFAEAKFLLGELELALLPRNKLEAFTRRTPFGSGVPLDCYCAQRLRILHSRSTTDARTRRPDAGACVSQNVATAYEPKRSSISSNQPYLNSNKRTMALARS